MLTEGSHDGLQEQLVALCPWHKEEQDEYFEIQPMFSSWQRLANQGEFVSILSHIDRRVII
jgi:hypothetical protein